MTQEVVEHLLSVGRNAVTLPVDAVPLSLVKREGAAWLCVSSDATATESIERVFLLAKAGDLMPDPQGRFIGSVVVAEVGYHCFELTDAA